MGEGKTSLKGGKELEDYEEGHCLAEAIDYVLSYFGKRREP
jgi:hypothetical protein